MLPILRTMNTHLGSSPWSSAKCAPSVGALHGCLSGRGPKLDVSPIENVSSSSPADCDTDAIDADDVWLVFFVAPDVLPEVLDATVLALSFMCKPCLLGKPGGPWCFLASTPPIST